MLLLLIATQRAFGVEPLRVTATDPVLVERNWTAFDRSSGLVGQVLALFEDRDGRIWLGNGRGAQFYDGYVWESFDLGSRVGAITQDVDGALWFGAMAPVRLVRYDGNDWTTIGLDDSLTTGLTWNALLPARDGSLWGGLRNVGLRVSRGVADLDLPGGIGRFDGNQWEMVAMPVGPPRPNVNHIIQTRDGALWFATEEGVLRYDGATWTRYTSRDGLAGDRVGQILEAADGSLWLACYKGLSRFDGTSWRRFAMRHGLERSIEMHSVWQTVDGAIWASGSPGVLSRFSMERTRAGVI